MQEEEFEYLLTHDKNLEFQQNLGKYDIKIIVIYSKTNEKDFILSHAAIIEAKILTAPKEDQVIRIDLEE